MWGTLVEYGWDRRASFVSDERLCILVRVGEGIRDILFVKMKKKIYAVGEHFSLCQL